MLLSDRPTRYRVVVLTPSDHIILFAAQKWGAASWSIKDVITDSSVSSSPSAQFCRRFRNREARRHTPKTPVPNKTRLKGSGTGLTTLKL
jgi:hypothetical protein